MNHASSFSRTSRLSAPPRGSRSGFDLLASFPRIVSKSLFQVGRPEGERSLPRQPLDNLRVIINSPEVVKITWIYGLFDINLTKEL